jgi:hypothetical protein
LAKVKAFPALSTCYYNRWAFKLPFISGPPGRGKWSAWEKEYMNAGKNDKGEILSTTVGISVYRPTY